MSLVNALVGRLVSTFLFLFVFLSLSLFFFNCDLGGTLDDNPTNLNFCLLSESGVLIKARERVVGREKKIFFHGREPKRESCVCVICKEVLPPRLCLSYRSTEFEGARIMFSETHEVGRRAVGATDPMGVSFF
jgi:hypothetical protein